MKCAACGNTEGVSEVHRIAAGERAAIVNLIRERANELNYYDGAYVLDEVADLIEEGVHHSGDKEVKGCNNPDSTR